MSTKTVIGGGSRSELIFSKQVTTGQRSFFFDVRRAASGELFFTINELAGAGSVWTRHRVVVPCEESRDFYYGLCDAIKAMREAEKQPNPALFQAPAPAATPASAKGSQRPDRATGRASQGANRQALLAGVR